MLLGLLLVVCQVTWLVVGCLPRYFASYWLFGMLLGLLLVVCHVTLLVIGCLACYLACYWLFGWLLVKMIDLLELGWFLACHTG